jgi:hypothetical protein
VVVGNVPDRPGWLRARGTAASSDELPGIIPD